MERIATGAKTWQYLEKVANEIAGRVQAPSKFRIWVKRGVAHSGRRQAFAQVIMEGSGALAVEFGTKKTRPIAPLRKALRGKGLRLSRGKA
jgi:hypothetical protein